MKTFTAYLAIHQHADELEKELKLKNIPIFQRKDRIFLVEGEKPSMIWAQISIFNLKEIPINSINDGVKRLKEMGRNWALFSVDHHRRAQLIQESLPKYKTDAIAFLAPLPKNPMGFWTLWEKDLILASCETSSLYPLGEVPFIENKTMPPSRAYLKLWEFFTLHAPDFNPQGVAIGISKSHLS